jgi:hypothetical protein
MAKKKRNLINPYDPVTLQTVIPCDTDKLYGNLGTAIAYLQEVRAAHPNHTLQLTEEWTGYEDMHMEFTLFRMETKEEAYTRADSQATLDKAREAQEVRVKKQRVDLAEENASHKRRVAAIINRGNI